MAAASEDAAHFLKALASAPRLRILCALTEGERQVAEIVARVGASDTAVSQHLAVLRRERMVSARREGQAVFYRLEGEAVRRVLETLYAQFCAPAQATRRRSR